MIGPRTGLAVAALALSVGVAPASAATAVGIAESGTFSCGPAGELRIPLEASYIAPGPGVITSWTTQRSAAGGQSALKTLRLTGAPNQSVVVGTSGVEPIVSAGISTFATRIPVATGDRLALWTIESGKCMSVAPLGVNLQYVAMPVDPGVGTAFVSGGVTQNSVRPSISAVIEPDANGDGFGDDSQSCHVPNLKGYTVTKAKTLLANAKCTLGKTSKKKLKKFTKKSKKNRIRTQSPKFGTLLAINSKVNITINTKKKAKKRT